jgi:hypothetical protein
VVMLASAPISSVGLRMAWAIGWKLACPTIRGTISPRGSDRGGEENVDIAAWLHGLGLQQYEQAFRDNDVDAEVLPVASRLLGLKSRGWTTTESTTQQRP